MKTVKCEMMRRTNKKIHHKQVHYQLLQSLVEGPPAANVREKLAYLDHALNLPCTDGGNWRHEGNDHMPTLLREGAGHGGPGTIKAGQ